ncbi:hypothetical protein A6302_04519 [Methylobrevis pamukkalensis]|uniref:Uncharacterized protein n=1 Tax=Methylobrevis pamukkalensis TaxID=1439726 RepID=A0A1E3GNR1_9HYPH|nr:hypothetical protein A6302_04519 [Methylobrevis pamukkalensis]
MAGGRLQAIGPKEEILAKMTVRPPQPATAAGPALKVVAAQEQETR